jgi:hypothetical protein
VRVLDIGFGFWIVYMHSRAFIIEVNT